MEVVVAVDADGVPQLYIGGELVGGADIVEEMHSKGELKDMLQAA